MKNSLLLSIFMFSILFASSENYWQPIEQTDLNHLEPQIQARNFSVAQLDVEVLDQVLNAALPFDVTNPYRHTVFQIEIPLPTGGLETYKVFNAPIMEDELANTFPDINTFMAISTTSSNYGRIDLTHKGFHAMIFTQNGTYFVDPYSALSNEFYISYFKKDFFSDKASHICLAQNEIFDDEMEVQHQELTLRTPRFGYGEELRTYRAAIAATGEYTQFHGGTVVDALAAIVTSLNRITGVYERDFSISFSLIGNNDEIIFTNSATDPYNNTDAGDMIGQNQTTIDDVIGSANYDIGHIFATGGSGLASQGVCSNNSKARGVTGISQPIGDPYDIDYVAHEIGHQFSASHTFNSGSGSCGSNRSQNNAYEPGSGTTIMAYAGICDPENVQFNSDDYFHTRSFIQIFNYTNSGTGDNCPVKTATGNNLPEITSITPTNTYTIPLSTPFEMNATATDSDNNTLTYCWEQYDRQNQTTPINSPTGNQPLFRSFNPVETGQRVFPRWDDILSGNSTLGERLPDYEREMNFRVLVRDNRPGAGGVFIANFEPDNPPSRVTVDVSNTAGPFVVNSPVNSTTWTSGTTSQVTWDVAGTDQNPINCSSVDILLSLDGGQNFNIILVEDSPNNGSASILVPEANTSEARILVKCSDNIFFNVNNGNFEIEFDCASLQTAIDVLNLSEDQDYCSGENIELSVTAFTAELSLSYQWTFNGSPIDGADESTLLIEDAQLSNSGIYACTISNACAQITTDDISIEVNSTPPAPTLFVDGDELISDYTLINQWYLDGVVINNASDFIFIPEVAGTYTVSALVDGCLSIPSNPIDFVPTSIRSLETLAQIDIYPSPNDGNFYISIENWNSPVEVEIVDMVGKKLLKQNVQQPSIFINLENLSTGVYFVKIQSNGLQTLKKVMVK